MSSLLIFIICSYKPHGKSLCPIQLLPPFLLLEKVLKDEENNRETLFDKPFGYFIVYPFSSLIKDWLGCRGFGLASPVQIYQVYITIFSLNAEKYIWQGPDIRLALAAQYNLPIRLSCILRHQPCCLLSPVSSLVPSWWLKPF